LTSASDIQSTLARHPEATNFIYCWDLAGHDFFGQWERHDRRVTKVFIDYFDGKAQEMFKTFRKPPEVGQAAATTRTLAVFSPTSWLSWSV
jgi:hypothetical protein